MKSRNSWRVYALCAGLVVAAMVWLTVTIERLERAERRARVEAARQEAVRLALWRMDSWLAPRLAKEAARPYFDYQAFYPQQRAYTRFFNEIEAGEVLTPSPLLTFHSNYFPLHFQVGPDGDVTSPQVPRGDQRELALAGYLTESQIIANQRVLERLRGVLSTVSIEDRMAQAATVLAGADIGMLEDMSAAMPETPSPLEARNAAEFSKRKSALEQSVQAVGRLGERYADEVTAQPPQRERVDEHKGLDDGRGVTNVDVGPFVALWIDDTLMFVRRVAVGGRVYHQGVQCHWLNLRVALLGAIGDLFAGADLLPVDSASAHPLGAGTMLATVPVALATPPAPAVAAPAFTPGRAVLLLTWIAVVAGLVAVAITLRATIHLGERRSRFASAVTHELRTPLTSFRMYTEMLADGMVAGEDKRKRYLDTLKNESARLARLVENVLSYARLEEGRRTAQMEQLRVEDLAGRLRPVLEHRVADSGMTLEVECDAEPGANVRTDLGAIEQILMNLVDNACKYGGGGGTIGLRITVDGGKLRMAVRDHGAGVSADDAAIIFQPFERGTNGNDTKPGIGLGLALSRGLARELGGDLDLKSSSDGACFELTLPAA